MHYMTSTNIGLLQSNLTYMNKKHGTEYHWLLQLFTRLNLPIFDGMKEGLEQANRERIHRLEVKCSDKTRKRRIHLKQHRLKDQIVRQEWCKKQKIQHDYGLDSDEETDHQLSAKRRASRMTQCKCVSTTHLRVNHRECPLNPKGKADVTSASCNSCKCGSTSHVSIRHSKCPLNPKLISGGVPPICQSKSEDFESIVSTESDSEIDLFASCESDPESEADDLLVPPAEFQIGDYVALHSDSLGKYHLPCRITEIVGDCYRLYCTQGSLKCCYDKSGLTPLNSSHKISLNGWRLGCRVTLSDVTCNPIANLEMCDCGHVGVSESAIELSSDEESEQVLPVNNPIGKLAVHDKEKIMSPKGWLSDQVIANAQDLILQQFPPILGLQSPILQEYLQYKVHQGEFCQIIHTGGNHWCVVANIGCDDGVVNVYDSLSPRKSKKDNSIAFETVRIIARLVLFFAETYHPSNACRTTVKPV